MFPSVRVSSTPVIVTVWGTFQLAGVKVRLEVETVPSVVSLELTGMVTLAVGGGPERDGEAGCAAGLGGYEAQSRIHMEPGRGGLAVNDIGSAVVGHAVGLSA